MKKHLAVILLAILLAPLTAPDAQAKKGWKPFCNNLHKLRISSDAVKQAEHNCEYKYYYTFKLKHSYKDLFFYVKDEDGYVDPIRTGYETDFYSYLKKRLKSGGSKKKLSPVKTFRAVTRLIRKKRKKKTRKRPVSVNAFEVLLTAHNVTRMLARPEQWSASLPAMANGRNRYIYDPASVIIKDLIGQRSVDDLKDFKSLMKISRFQHTRVYEAFFGKKGPYVFYKSARSAKGASPAHWNGGIHYYFWVGAMAEEVGYSAGRGVGGWAAVSFANIYETLQKKLANDSSRADVQLRGFERGAKWWRKTRALLNDVRAARRSYEVEARIKTPAKSISCLARNGQSCSAWNGERHMPGQYSCRKSGSRCLCRCRVN